MQCANRQLAKMQRAKRQLAKTQRAKRLQQHGLSDVPLKWN